MHFSRILFLFSSVAFVADCTAIGDNAKVLAELKSLGASATAFCSSFLGIPKKTVTAATVTPVVTVTATTIISTTIRVDKRSADCIVGLPCPDIQRRVNHPVPSGLTPFGQAVISLACSLFHVTPAVTTVTFTRTPTTTTTTTTTTSISTVHRQNCDADATYEYSGNGIGNTLVPFAGSNSIECCQTCQITQRCVASVFLDGTCQLLIKVLLSPNAATPPLCPVGVAGYPFGETFASGKIHKGPCA